jgi:hypothetical protein
MTIPLPLNDSLPNDPRANHLGELMHIRVLTVVACYPQRVHTGTYQFKNIFGLWFNADSEFLVNCQFLRLPVVCRTPAFGLLAIPDPLVGCHYKPLVGQKSRPLVGCCCLSSSCWSKPVSGSGRLKNLGH